MCLDTHKYKFNTSWPGCKTLPQILMNVLMVLLAVSTHVLTMMEGITVAVTLDTHSVLT